MRHFVASATSLTFYFSSIALLGAMYSAATSGVDCFSAEELDDIRRVYNIPKALDRSDSRALRLQQGPYAGHMVTTRAATILLHDLLGYSFVFVEPAPPAEWLTRLAEGLDDANFEIWPVGKEDIFRKYKDLIHTAPLGVAGTSGWYAPSFLLNGSCFASDFWRSWVSRDFADSIGLPRYPNVSSSLYDPLSADPFVNTPRCVANASDSNGCYEFLHMHTYYDWGIVQQQIANLGAPFATVYIGQEQLERIVLERISKSIPSIFYHWEPTVFIAKEAVTRILLPSYRNDCGITYNGTNASLFGEGDAKCDFPSLALLKARTRMDKTDLTRRDFVSFFETFRVSNSGQMAMMEMLNSSEPTHEEAYDAACRWLKQSPDQWAPSIFNRPVYVDVVPVSLQNAITVISAIFLLLSILVACLVHCYRASEEVRASSVEFMYPIIAACSGGYISALMLSIDPQDELACRASLFTLSEATVALLLFGGAKVWRVMTVFFPDKLKGEIRSSSSIAFWMILVIGGNILIDILWLLIDPPTIEVIEKVPPLGPPTSAPFETLRLCRLNGVKGGLLTMSFAYKVCVLAWALVISYKSLGLPERFNDAKAIAVGLYNIAIFSAIALILLLFVEENPPMRFIASTIPPLYCPSMLLTLLLGPRLKKAIGGGSMVEEESEDDTESVSTYDMQSRYMYNTRSRAGSLSVSGVGGRSPVTSTSVSRGPRTMTEAELIQRSGVERNSRSGRKVARTSSMSQAPSVVSLNDIVARSQSVQSLKAAEHARVVSLQAGADSSDTPSASPRPGSSRLSTLTSAGASRTSSVASLGASRTSSVASAGASRTSSVTSTRRSTRSNTVSFPGGLSVPPLPPSLLVESSYAARLADPDKMTGSAFMSSSASLSSPRQASDSQWQNSVTPLSGNSDALSNTNTPGQPAVRRAVGLEQVSQGEAMARPKDVGAAEELEMDPLT